MAFYICAEKSKENARYTYQMGDSFEWGATLFETPEKAADAALEVMGFSSMDEFKEETGEEGIYVKVVGRDIVLTVTDL